MIRFPIDKLLFLPRPLLWSQIGDEGLKFRQSPFQVVDFCGIGILGLIRTALAGPRHGRRCHCAICGRRIRFQLDEFKWINNGGAIAR